VPDVAAAISNASPIFERLDQQLSPDLAVRRREDRVPVGPRPLRVCMIVGYDLKFAESLPRLFPSKGQAMKAHFQSDAALTQTTAFRNGTLQGGYLIQAARALGLDCGPMSGFNNAAVDAAFFAGTDIKSNFLCSIGYGNDKNLFPRNPRLSFEEAGRFA